MLVVDFHVHSPFSRATSKSMSLPVMELWARRKGLQVLGTGDCTHPGQGEAIKTHLVEAEEGLFRLREKSRLAQEWAPPGGEVRFCLTGEISNIYKRGGRVRKVHNVVVLSSLGAMDRFRERLDGIGNIRSDGRPILGLDSQDLFALLLECDPDGWLIPAHIWTPWFSVLGSKSGFDALEECYGDLTGEIFALETGLSSDPPMNDRLSGLDRYALVSSSDAHSAPNLLREATLLECPLSLPAMRRALADPDPAGRPGTIEFFPEEGKYHLDGHRKCGVRLEPEERAALGGKCPVCGKPVTVGVLSRVVELADRGKEDAAVGGRPYVPLLPLAQVIGAAMGKGPATKGVKELYRNLLREEGDEFTLLTRTPLERIASLAGPLTAEGVRRVRSRHIRWEAGFDGEYGKPILFEPGEKEGIVTGGGLFGEEAFAVPVHPAPLLPGLADPPSPPERDLPRVAEPAASSGPGRPEPWLAGLDPDQLAAAVAPAGPLLVSAPPGAGKTRTLVARTAHRILAGGLAPEAIMVVTFTRKAAAELRERLAAMPGLAEAAARIRAGTIHAQALELLGDRVSSLRISGRVEAERMLTAAAAEAGLTLEGSEAEEFFRRRLSLDLPAPWRELEEAFRRELSRRRRIDLDGLVLACREGLAVGEILPSPPVVFLAVDEYQDVDPAQAAMLDLLAGQKGDFTAIGDPDQSIYAFRGADPGLFADFDRRHPSTVRLHLGVNYRSTANLVAAAAPFRSGNPCRAASPVEGEPIRVHRAPTAAAEAEFLAHRIEELVGGVSHFSMDSGRTAGDAPEYGFEDIAILCRTRAQEPALAEALIRLGVPLARSGEEENQDRRALARLAGWLRLLRGEADDLDLGAALEDWRAARILAAGAARRGLSLGAAVESHPLFGGIKGATREELGRLARSLPGWRRLWEEDQPRLLHTLVGELARRGLELPRHQAEGLDRTLAAEGVEGLGRLLATGTLADLAGPPRQQVTLSTLHGAKGLEFPLVFIAGVEEGFLPFTGGRSPADPAEERRLFFVGMTRARERLFLVASAHRVIHGRNRERELSPFVAEIPPALRIESAPRRRAGGGRRGRQLELFGD